MLQTVANTERKMPVPNPDPAYLSVEIVICGDNGQDKSRRLVPLANLLRPLRDL